ncbi:DNA primase [Streptomyces sp. NPDC101151]|uniref:DNA primase n=1 Tax=Streptomyces sp. NPDC101151 TaxID=3366115 RepID=UPI003809EEDF
MNRTALGLAIGAGYLLGRTKKMKMALAVGSLVAGKKLNLGPRGLAELVQQQLRDNPQFKEIGDQLREDLRGVGKAATGAMAERQMSALADRLHDRTSSVRDQLSGAVPEIGSDEEDDDEEEPRKESGHEEDARESRQAPRRKKAAEKPSQKRAPAKKAEAKAPAKKAAGKKTGPARKPGSKRTASAGGAVRGGRSRQSKGGDDR